jgi:4-hydroxy-tetrahydrodipicolinate synthase
MITSLPKGLWPVMLTPLLENNNLDLEGLRKLTDFYIASGANGLFSNCLSSEMYQLTQEERLLVIATVVDQCQERIPVVATGTFSINAKINADFIKKVYDKGVAAVIIISGIMVDIEEGEDILKLRLEETINKTGEIPLGLYECPVPYKRLVSPDMMNWLASSGRFIYHKDTSCNSLSIKLKLTATEGSNYGLYNADTPTAIESLKDGARGFSPISANFYPEFFSYLYKEFTGRGLNEEHYQFYTQLIIMDRIIHDFYPYSAKIFLRKRGLHITDKTRIPYEAMTSADMLRLNAVFDRFRYLSDHYEIELKV